MGHYVRLALLPGNKHGPVDVDMVTIPRNNDLSVVMVVVMMRRAGDMDVVVISRNNHRLVSVVVVVIVW